jgi:membrane protease YdiL (CAAX protease family)
MRFWWAALLLSVVFALCHISNGGEAPLGLLVVGVGGFARLVGKVATAQRVRWAKVEREKWAAR